MKDNFALVAQHLNGYVDDLDKRISRNKNVIQQLGAAQDKDKLLQDKRNSAVAALVALGYPAPGDHAEPVDSDEDDKLDIDDDNLTTWG